MAASYTISRDTTGHGAAEEEHSAAEGGDVLVAACAGLAPPSEVAMAGSSVPEFVPILAVAEAAPADPVPEVSAAVAIEVELAGAVVRVMAGTDGGLLAAVLRAIRASASA